MCSQRHLTLLLLSSLLVGLSLTACATDDDSGGNQSPDVTERGDVGSDDDAEGDEGDHSEPWERWLEPGEFGFLTEERVFIDSSRTLPSEDGEAAREFKVTIWLPETYTDRSPLIIWAHGLMSERADSAQTARLLARRGYIVAAPNFPLTHRGASDPDILDVANQPADVSFVLDQMLAANDDEDDSLYGRIDTDKIGGAGVSLGAITMLLTGWHEPFKDDRFDTIITLTPPACFAPRPVFPGDGPVTVVTLGDSDAVVDFDSTRPPLIDEAPDSVLMLRYIGGTHTAFADRVGSILDGIDHIDSIACSGGVSANLNIESLGALSESLGGLATEVMREECMIPCQNHALELTTLIPSRQIKLTRALVVGAFEATLGGAPDSLEDIGAEMMSAPELLDLRADE